MSFADCSALNIPGLFPCSSSDVYPKRCSDALLLYIMLKSASVTIMLSVTSEVMDPKKCRGYWNHMGHSCSICQIACPWNFESTRFHDLTRNFNQNFSWFRRPAVWGYKLFYERSKWNPDPKWVKTYGHED